MTSEQIFLAAFLVLIGTILAFDLGIFGKKTDEVSLKKAGVMSFAMVALAGIFYFLLTHFGHMIHGIDSVERLQYIVKKHHHPVRIDANDFAKSLKNYDRNLGVEFFTGYIVEYALSVDNIFVIVLIFSSFGVAKSNYHRVLFWGIIGAVMMRFLFIFIGSALIERFDWILYVFGIFLVYTGIKMFLERDKDEEIDAQHHPVVKFCNKYFKVHKHFVGSKFFVTINGVRKITPLLVVLVIIEITDLIFAVDSIPAIFSVTKDPYIVFFSNIFAIIGLRSMFFLLAGVIDKLRFLKIGLAFLLVFIGAKMLLHTYLEGIGFKTTHSLIIIVAILGTSIGASLLFPEPKVKERKLLYNPETDDEFRQ